MKDIIFGLGAIVFVCVMTYILIKEERKLHDNYLKNEIEKTKIMIDEFKKND